MASGSSPKEPALTVGQLEAGYPACCKALRLLLQEGRTLTEIQRTVCWERLDLLYKALPRQYRDPVLLHGLLKRQMAART
jgi:hypothetical protein